MKKTLLTAVAIGILTSCSSEDVEKKVPFKHDYSKDQIEISIPSKSHTDMNSFDVDNNKVIDALTHTRTLNGNPITEIFYYSPEKEAALRRQASAKFRNYAYPIPKDLVLELSELKAKTNYIQERLDNIVIHFDSLSKTQKDMILSKNPQTIETYLEKNVKKTNKPKLSEIHADPKKESVSLHSVILIDYTKNNTALFQGPYGRTALKTNGEELFRSSKYFVQFVPYDKPIKIKGAKFEIEGIIDSIRMQTKEGL